MNFIMPGQREYKLPKNKYCGAEKLPEGKEYGTFDQCSLAGQIRLWNRRDFLFQKLMVDENELNKMREKFKYAKDARIITKMDEYQDRIEELKEIIKDQKKEMKKLDKLKAENDEGTRKYLEKDFNKFMTRYQPHLWKK